MRRPCALLACFLGAVLLGSCATSAIIMAPDHPDHPWTPATDANGEIVPGAPPGPDQPPNSTYVLPANKTLASVPPPQLGLERHRPYSLPELIDIAQRENPTTRVAWDDARNAALVAGIAESAFLPLVSAGIVGGWQKTHVENSVLGNTLTNDITARGNLSVLSIQWLLFDFGERAALLDVAKQGSVISNIAFNAAHQQVIYKVSLAFYAYAAARGRLASTAEALRDAEEVRAAAEGKYKQGVGTVVEAAQTRQVAAEAQLERVQAEGTAENAYQALISAIGVSPMTRLLVADVSRRKLPGSMGVPVERFVVEALAQRPDVLTGYAAVQASLAGLRAAEAEFFPKVFLAANGTRLSGNLNITAIPGIDQQLPIVNLPGNQLGNSGTQFGSTALLGATVPLYDGGIRAASFEQARTKVDKADTTLTQIRNEAVHQIIVARNTLKTSLSAHSASTVLAAASRTTFDAALAAYRNGVGSISDVTTAERQLLAAKNAVTDAYSAALSAAAALALAGGTLGGAPR